MQQKITVRNKRGEKLVGILHETGSPKLVVLCHGFRSTKEYYMMVNLAAALENEGISAFRFDFSGNGESEGSFQFGNYSSEAEDLRSVVEYFSGLNRSTIVVLGHSKGGDDVLLYASKYHDIPAVVNVSGRYALKRGLEERLGNSFLERLKKDGCIDVKTKKVFHLLNSNNWSDVPAAGDIAWSEEGFLMLRKGMDILDTSVTEIRLTLASDFEEMRAVHGKGDVDNRVDSSDCG